MRTVTVRCPTCPDHPVLNAPEETDTRRCIRCQGEHRRLREPHPGDHLCDVCRSECPRCDAPAGPGLGGLCRACSGRCRDCGGQLSLRSTDTTVVTAPPRAGGDRTRVLFPSTWTKSLCDRCLHSRAADRERQVTRTLPPKLLRACGGSAPARAVYVIRAELERNPVRRLTERIERRWWQQWSDRPLRRAGDEDVAGYGPDDVAVWLVSPSGCRGGCEDGWVPDNPDEPCPVCRPRTPYRAVATRTAVSGDMAATARAAVRSTQARQPVPTGEYVPASATAGDDEDRDRVRRLESERRTRPLKRRPEVTLAEEQADPVWAAARRRAREERESR
ncbi:hypothetical protein POF50_010375 [Streptomyces sp. SL13]|uniref:Uncharacterized protein n=1 Tax=Streptantibioticus silvisoli TaxID=2705255 RepID=A0AA90H6L2_9ACTN|nr:hypothetical protein [Streptantibioticus silvisoli]MDI5962910.1 hypothetical protein [Streptantibioticus silvisoli]MDI5969740.1 hypothetical protein [Streptantibioticus silvisoli]